MQNDMLSLINIIFFFVVIITVALALINFLIRCYNKEVPPINAYGKQQIQCFEYTDFKFNDKVYYILLAIIVVIGVSIRVWKFGSVPGGFNQDGAMAAVDGKALADYGTDRFGTHLPAHLYAWGFGQMSSLMSYMIAIFVKFFGLSPITARLPQLLVSIMGGVFFYLFIRELFGKSAGLIAAAFVAIDPWHLLQSRWALDCNLFAHFFMGGIYFLNKGLTKRRRYLFVSMIFFGLCMYCYGIALYTIPVFLVAVCIYYLIYKRLKWQDVILSAAIYLAIAWPFLLTMMINFFKWDTIELPFVTMQYFPATTRTGDILFFSEEPFKQLLINIKALLGSTIWQMSDAVWNYIEGFGHIFLCSLPFMAAGCVELARTKTKGAKSLVVFAILTGVWVGLITREVNVNRMNIIYYSMMMFVVLGIYFTVKEIRYARWTNLCIFATLSVMLVTTYFGPYNDSIKERFFYGFGDAYALIQNTDAEKIYITADTMMKNSVGTSEILTLFYDKTDAEYFQGKKNENNGRKLLPYKQRFTYVSMSPQVVASSRNQNAAYVILDSDKKYFDKSKFYITEYGGFCAVVPKKH